MKSFILKISLLLFMVLISGSFFDLISRAFSILYKPSLTDESESYNLPVNIQLDVIVPKWDVCSVF